MGRRCRNGIDRPAVEVAVEDGCGESFLLDQAKGLFNGRRRPHGFGARILQRGRYDQGNKWFVFDHQEALVGEDAACRVHCVQRSCRPWCRSRTRLRRHLLEAAAL